MIEPIKQCKICGETKPLRDFPKHKTGKDGHRNFCRVCYATKQHAHYIGEADDPLPGFKVCRRCRTSKPMTEFGDPLCVKVRLYAHCSQCRAKHYTRKTEPVVRGADGRVCSTCKVWKPYTEYYKKSNCTADGHWCICKVCIKGKVAQYRKSPEYTKRMQDESVKSRLREYGNQWQKDNRDKMRASTQRYRAKHPDRVWTYQKCKTAAKDLAAFKATIIERRDRRRAKLATAEGSYTAQEFLDLCCAYGYRCLRCGRDDVKLTVDHVVPISRGGSNSIENIQPLCQSCNSAKGARNSADYRVNFKA